jgi:hypothetical protein
MTGILTAFFAYRTVVKLEVKHPVLIIFFLCFTPLYCIMLFTTLTEILFGFVLVLAIYFFFHERFIMSAVTISFLPFARSEGYVILSIFFLAYLLKKKFKAIPFIFFGFLLFSIAGYFYYKDPLWVIHQFPYVKKHDIYTETGPFLHFFNKRYFIIGFPLQILFLTGLFAMILKLFSGNPLVRGRAFYVFFIIFLPFIVYFLFHSFLYWSGIGGSVGEIRVMAGILPLSAILCLMGYQLIDTVFFPERWRKITFAAIVISGCLYTNFTVFQYPLKLGPEEETVKQSATWLQSRNLLKNQVYFTDLNACFFLGRDPYDLKQSNQLWSARDINSLPDSSLLIWDAHFGPNESKIPLDTLTKNPHFMLLKRFVPAVEWNTFGGLPYEVDVFMKVPGSF